MTKPARIALIIAAPLIGATIYVVGLMFMIFNPWLIVVVLGSAAILMMLSEIFPKRPGRDD